MLVGVSGESLCGLIVGLRDSFPPFVSLIYMVSRMRVRWWGVTSVDAYMVMGVSFVSGKSPAEPDQKELPQTATESVGMIVSAGVVRYFLIVSVCDSSAISIHGRLCVRGSVIVFQSTLLPAAFITVGSCPVAGVLMGSVCVGMNGLCGMASCMVVAVIASARPWSRWGSSEEEA